MQHLQQQQAVSSDELQTQTRSAGHLQRDSFSDARFYDPQLVSAKMQSL
jgi:hypothetical protein